MAEEGKEARRVQAYALKQKGWKQVRIAQALGVTKGAVSQWMKCAQQAGKAGLAARPRCGAPRRLSEAQLQVLPEFLSHGAEAYGFRGEVWTCARVGKVIEQEFEVTYDKSQVSRLLKQIAWTPQKPVERASQRGNPLVEQVHADRGVDLRGAMHLLGGIEPVAAFGQCTGAGRDIGGDGSGED